MSSIWDWRVIHSTFIAWWNMIKALCNYHTEVIPLLTPNGSERRLRDRNYLCYGFQTKEWCILECHKLYVCTSWVGKPDWNGFNSKPSQLLGVGILHLFGGRWERASPLGNPLPRPICSTPDVICFFQNFHIFLVIFQK